MKKNQSRLITLILCLSFILQPVSGISVYAADNEMSGSKVIPSKEELLANDNVVYFVNCGAAIVDKVADGDRMGLYQSVTDKDYGLDAATGWSWGYRPSSSVTGATNPVAGGNSASLNKEDTFYYMGAINYVSGTSGFYYDFELPEGSYEVTVGFKNPWSWRPVDVVLEGTTYDDALSLPQNTLVESVHEVAVTDGQLNVFVHNPDRTDVYKDPLINYIIIKEVPVYDTSILQAKINMIANAIVKAQASGVVYATEPLGEKYLDVAGTKDTITDMNALLKEADTMIGSGTAAETEIQAECDKLDVQFSALRTIKTYHSFSGTDGAIWMDTNGVPIQAHGGQVQKLNGKWWWYGEDKTKGYRSNGISAYSSDDLYNWTFEGYVMRTVTSRDQLDTDDYFKTLYADYTKTQKDNVYLCINNTTSVIERPKVIYNKSTGKYVMWFHADGPTQESEASYAAACAGVAVSDSPTGPFRFIDRYRLNVCPDDQLTGAWYEGSKGFARDMNLFVDDDETAYIIYSSEENRTMFISKLNADYTYLSAPVDKAVYGVDYVRLFPGAQREAPAVFKYDNKYYMINSGATGWNPNQAQCWSADSILGAWTNEGNPCVNDTKNTTFDSQSTNVIPYDVEKGLYIYMGDRWNSSDLADSRYVWLPVNITANRNIRLNSYQNWNLDTLQTLIPVKVNTELQDIYYSVEKLPQSVSISVYENGAYVLKTAAVNWDTSEVLPTVQTKVTGDLPGYNSQITANLFIIPDTLKYYIDSGATAGSYNYDMISKQVALLNETYDKAYIEGSWGYTGIMDTDIGLKNNTSTDAFDSGFWAYKDKTIDYVLPLKAGSYQLLAGFQEWWGATRNVGISVSYEQGGTAVTIILGHHTNTGTKTVNYSFDLPVDADVKVSVYEYTPGSDMILSWVAVNDTTDSGNPTEEELNKSKSITVK